MNDTREIRVAGRVLDVLIAEQVMGIIPVPYHGLLEAEIQRMHREEVPEYSTCIAAAWEVVEKFRAHPYRCLLVCDHPDGYECQITSRVAMDRMWYGHADTAPLAICLAVLKAVDR